ncbi:MAG: hypothetical protein DMF01_03510 [Verrucomicrobia bacterium]|nr:MAG: hypothetical protein DMF01_03510 [Verrucomicrobiota bacterium]
MIIRWALGLRSGSRRDLNHLTGGTPGRWFAIAFALYLAPVFLSAQTMPAPATSKPAGGTSQQTAGLAGLTLTQAASKLTESYGRDYLVNPKVNVMLLSYVRQRFSILGQVNRPSSYEMPEGSPDGIDLLEAIAIAGGYTRIAAPERITVRRQNANGDQIFKVNAKRFTKGTGGGFLILPGDTITVGESIF